MFSCTNTDPFKGVLSTHCLNGNLSLLLQLPTTFSLLRDLLRAFPTLPVFFNEQLPATKEMLGGTEVC